MSLTDLLKENEETIVREATAAIARTPLSHYRAIDNTETLKRIARLFNIVRRSIEKRDATEMLEYSRAIARDRFEGEFPLHEVLCAFNTLEEVIWRKITELLDPKDFAQALGSVSTVFGFGKETLATEYVTLTAKKPPASVPVLDLSELFKGI